MWLPPSWLHLILAGFAVAPAVGATACAAAPCPAEVPMQVRPRLDPGILRQMEQSPDSVVGVLVRTTRPPTDADRRALADAGLRVGTVAGEILTGRLRACDAARVANLEFVRHIELAREVRIPSPPEVR
jgi:hypothetical protein